MKQRLKICKKKKKKKKKQCAASGFMARQDYLTHFWTESIVRWWIVNWRSARQTAWPSANKTWPPAKIGSLNWDTNNRMFVGILCPLISVLGVLHIVDTPDNPAISSELARPCIRPNNLRPNHPVLLAILKCSKWHIPVKEQKVPALSVHSFILIYLSANRTEPRACRLSVR